MRKFHLRSELTENLIFLKWWLTAYSDKCMNDLAFRFKINNYFYQNTFKREIIFLNDCRIT